MRSTELRSRRQGAVRKAITVGASIGLWVVASAQAEAQQPRAQQPQAQTPSTLPPEGGSYSQLLPPSHDEIADQERLSWTLSKFPSQPYMREFYWQLPTDTPAFFRDSLLQVVARSYYLTRDNFDGSRSQAETVGGWIAYRSGLIGNIFGVHGALYTSQPLFAPNDQNGTKLLTSDGSPLNSLGQAYVRAQVQDQEFRYGRQLVDTPLINPQDNRMVPNTFQGLTLVTLPDKDRNYDYAAGYLQEIKQRDSNAFVSMSNALVGTGIPAEGQGAPFAMVRYRPFSGLSTVLMDYNVQNYLNTAFGQAEYDFKQPKQVPNWILGANIIDQRSVGDDLLTGTSFQTYQASGKVQMVYAGWTAFAAGSVTGEQSKLYSPFGTKPNYTDMQQVSFDNAGEKSAGASLAYDFGYAYGQYGLSGLSVGGWYTQGWDAINPVTGAGINDRKELDVWMQYRPTEGPFKGFRLKVQYSDLWQDGNFRNPQSEFRTILDYTVLFRPPTK
jgi:hypothetical protein